MGAVARGRPLWFRHHCTVNNIGLAKDLLSPPPRRGAGKDKGRGPRDEGQGRGTRSLPAICRRACPLIPALSPAMRGRGGRNTGSQTPGLRVQWGSHRTAPFGASARRTHPTNSSAMRGRGGQEHPQPNIKPAGAVVKPLHCPFRRVREADAPYELPRDAGERGQEHPQPNTKPAGAVGKPSHRPFRCVRKADAPYELCVYITSGGTLFAPRRRSYDDGSTGLGAPTGAKRWAPGGRGR